MNPTWKVSRIVLIIIGGGAALFAVLLFYLWASGRIWYPRQRSRVAALAEQPIVQADEDDVATAPLDDDLPLNALRMIATHNSYHLEPDWIRRFLIGLAEPDEPAKLRYSHRLLWDQLDNGVRSFELDVRARAKRFTVIHVPLVDNRGPNPDFARALQEISLWSDHHRAHVPIIVLLELKHDWMILDPGLKEWTADTLRRLDALIESVVPRDRLLTPADVRRDALTVADGIARYGWPTLGQSRGKIVFVVHTDPEIDPLYVHGDAALTDRPLFTSRPGEAAPQEEVAETPGLAPGRPDAAFVIHNDPARDSISPLVAAGLMVRTRADGDGSATPEQRSAALGSGAQIISTDYPPGHPNGPSHTAVEFGPGRTLTQTRER